jgi:drug/metabolite transporter (DMT)-like permease
VTTHSEAQSDAYFAEPGISDPLLLASLLGGMDAALFAVALLSEELTWLQIAGGVAIGLALVLARRRPALESA